MPAGRPTKYDPSFCERVIELGGIGASKLEMSVKPGLSRDSFHQYERDYTEFSDAVKIAMAISQQWWEEKGRTAVFESQGFNATAYIFNMKNRFKEDWSDMTKVEHSGSMSITGLYDAVNGKTDGIPSEDE